MKLLRAVVLILAGVLIAAAGPFLGMAAGPVVGFAVFVTCGGIGVCLATKGVESW